MAYLHCHRCLWSQDDYWSKESYNPISHSQHYADDLFREKIHADLVCFKDLGIPVGKVHEDSEGYWVKGTDFVAYELRRTARSIENMDVLTSEEWQKVKDTWKCPRCGSSDEWDID
jgi:hypothetical protein